jgi:4-aminobutyrate aminotransferase-like enzyme
VKTAQSAAPSAAPIPGPRSRAAHSAEQQFIAPGLQRIAQLSELTIERGRGSTLVDADGNEYLDFFAGVAVASLGHAHPRYVRALQAQLEKWTVGSFTSEARLALLELLAELAPGELSRTQLYSGGAEAVEAALRLAKSYTKKFEVVGFWGGFHGKTAGVMGLIGDEWKQHWGPLPTGTHLVPYADCYRCPLKLAYPSCGMACLDFAREQLKVATAGEIAAVIVEPMQGTAGNVIPPPEFLPGVQSIAKDHGALLIADEMITGFGRTGKMFACEHTGTVPDVITMGKGFGCGFPVTGLISTEEITASRPFSKPSSSSSSYGGNPLAATAALATVQTILDEGLVENAAQVGAVLLDGLRGLQEKYEFIGDVRGVGLMIGVEFVKDRATREPAPEIVEQLVQGAFQQGLLLLGAGKSTLRLAPPLVVGSEDIDTALAMIDAQLSEIA